MKDSDFENSTVMQEVINKIKNASSDKEFVEALYTLSLAVSSNMCLF